MRQSEPTRVMPPPPAVPREMVTYSRMVVVVADLEACGLACVLEVLRGDAEAGEGEDAVVAADGEVAVVVAAEDDVGDEFAVFAEDDVGADGAPGADGAACGDLCARSNDRCGVDAHSAVSGLALQLSWLRGGRPGT